MNKGALFAGIWLTIPAIYLLFSLFFDAPWLQPKWGRKFGRPAVVPLSRVSRVLWLLLTVTFAAAAYVSAFDCDVKRFTRVGVPVLLVTFVLIILSGIRDGRRFTKNHDKTG